MNKTQLSLKVVEQHFQYEGAEDIEQVIADYTDDIAYYI